jgi:hypothetical protein
MANKTSLAFRAWFYLRNGWGQYFAFAFAAINTLVVTYYLAIENLPILNDLFPSFLSYALTVVLAGVPILIAVGYWHYKKSPAYKTEADVVYEANPYLKRTLENTENILKIQSKLMQLILSVSQKDEITNEDKKSIQSLQKEIDDTSKKFIDRK